MSSGIGPKRKIGWYSWWHFYPQKEQIFIWHASFHFINQKSTYSDILRPKRKIVEHPHVTVVVPRPLKLMLWSVTQKDSDTFTSQQFFLSGDDDAMMGFGFSVSYFPCQRLFSSWYWQAKKILASLLTVVAEAENKWPGPHLLALVSTFSLLKIITMCFNRQAIKWQRKKENGER